MTSTTKLSEFNPARGRHASYWSGWDGPMCPRGRLLWHGRSSETTRWTHVPPGEALVVERTGEREVLFKGLAETGAAVAERVDYRRAGGASRKVPRIKRRGLLNNSILAQACDIVIEALKERGLEPQAGSRFSEELSHVEPEERRRWLLEYVTQNTWSLLNGILDQVYKLGSCIYSINPSPVSVAEFILLRSIIEYSYKLSYLTVLDVDADERIKRAIECAHEDLVAYERLPSRLRSNSAQHRRPFLEEWYKEITGKQKPKHPLRARDLFDDLGGSNEEWQRIAGEWPADRGGKAVNPAYQSGYAIWSAITHGNAWAIAHFGLTKDGSDDDDPRWFPGLNPDTIHNCEELAVRLLQHAFGFSVQLMNHRGLDAGAMNRLEEVIARIREPRVSGSCRN